MFFTSAPILQPTHAEGRQVRRGINLLEQGRLVAECFGILKFPSISRIPLPRMNFKGAAKANKQGAVAGGSNEGVTSVSTHSQQALKFLHFACHLAC